MIVVAISGASGPILGIRLIEELLNQGEAVSAIMSEPARQIIEYEMQAPAEHLSSLTKLLSTRKKTARLDLLEEYDNNDFFSPAASGSTRYEAVVVIPASMKTISAIAHGYADTLITRTCDVALKEKRRCIVVPRETPLGMIHLENLLKLAQAGADIVPPVPGFYTRPKTVDDIVNFIVGKVLNMLGKEHSLFERWDQSYIKNEVSENHRK